MHSPQLVVSAPDRAIANPLQQKIDRKTKPLGALGQLEAVAHKIGLVQQTLTPKLSNPQFLVFAGDHGAAKAGVSAYPQDVTWQMVENFLAGGAGINVFARQNGLGLTVVDAGVAHDFGARPGLVDAKMGPGTRNYIEEPAMAPAECVAAMERGAEIIRNLAGNGCNVVGFGEMGIGNTAAASLITHCLTGASLEDCIGRGTGLDDAGLSRKRVLLDKALARAGKLSDPLAVLAEFGGFEIAMMAGAMIAAAQAGMVVLVDGFIVGSAALVAARLAPALTDYCVFCHRSAEPGHRAQLAALGAEPLLDLGLRLGEGTGAALAYPLVQAAVNFLNEMASFESAGVSDRVSGDEPDSRSTQDAPASALTGGDVTAAGPGHHKC
jgi:nicotinate-nucleotide--dimethylbenzimidazole phosphoribosyltransferase